MKKVIFFFVLLSCLKLYSQSEIIISEKLNVVADSATKKMLLSNIKSFFNNIDNGKITDEKITQNENSALSKSIFSDFKDYSSNPETKQQDYYTKQLLNLYKTSDNQWIATVSYSAINSGNKDINAIINILVTTDKNSATFSIPMPYLTKKWQKRNVQNTEYFFPDQINLKSAKIFNEKNKKIAERLKLKVENYKFYLCSNYQEILQLFGIEYDKESNGISENGYGVDSGYIFSVNHNEDFSHDVFHNYSEKIRGKNRNRYADEGFAYTWGDAYYVDKNGETISQQQLIKLLKNYLKENPNADLLELLHKDTKIFKEVSPYIHVSSLLSSIVCDEVWNQKGYDGTVQLLNCGKSEEDFFKATKNIIGIDQSNFSEKAKKILENYK